MHEIKDKIMHYIDKTKLDTVDQCNLHTNKLVEGLGVSVRKAMEEKHKSVLKVMRSEMAKNIDEEVRNRLQVPGLIGNNQPYSTLSNFLMTFYNQADEDLRDHKTKLAAILSRMDSVEKSKDIMTKWRQDFERQTRQDFEKCQKEDSRIRGMLNQTRTKMDSVVKEAKQFTAPEKNQLKEIANTEWITMKNKVNNLAQEVFDEVVEHEMALAGLDDEDLDEVYPQSPIHKQQHKSLLKRMSTLKANIVFKRKSGIMPKFDKPTELDCSDSSLQQSITEEDSHEASSGRGGGKK